MRRRHQSRRSEDRVFVVLRARPRPRSGRRRGVVRRDRARRMVGQLGPSGSRVASTLSRVSMQFVSSSLLVLRCLRSLSFMLPPSVCRGGRTSSSGAQVSSSRNVSRGRSSSGSKNNSGSKPRGFAVGRLASTSNNPGLRYRRAGGGDAGRLERASRASVEIVLSARSRTRSPPSISRRAADRRDAVRSEARCHRDGHLRSVASTGRVVGPRTSVDWRGTKGSQRHAWGVPGEVIRPPHEQRRRPPPPGDSQVRGLERRGCGPDSVGR